MYVYTPLIVAEASHCNLISIYLIEGRRNREKGRGWVRGPVVYTTRSLLVQQYYTYLLVVAWGGFIGGTGGGDDDHHHHHDGDDDDDDDDGDDLGDQNRMPDSRCLDQPRCSAALLQNYHQYVHTHSKC
jgi:hypothetical protein